MEADTEASYAEQWRKNRKGWHAVVIGAATWLCGSALAATFVNDRVGSWLLPALAGPLIWAGIRYDPRCPRCGRSLIKPSAWQVAYFARECVSCGLLVGAPRNPDGK